MKKTIFACSVLALCLFATAGIASFTQGPIPNDLKQKLFDKGLWKETCPDPLERFSLLHISYYDFKGTPHDDGRMIVIDAAAPYVLDIFKKLYRENFPLEKVRLTSEYGGDDNLSMADNNTSAFNCREVTGGGLISAHAYGLAVDINPAMNPFVGPLDKEKGTAEVLPPAGLGFLNRSNERPGMVNGSVISIFEKNGFPVWGGKWNDPIDWQHFQTSRTISQLIASMTPNDAQKMFGIYVKYHNMLTKASYKEEGARLGELYKQDSANFMRILSANIKRLNDLPPKEAVQFIEKELTTPVSN